LRAERRDGAIDPGRIAGHDDDTVRIADKDVLAAFTPFQAQLFQFDLDDDDAKDAAGERENRTGDEIAGTAGGHTDREQAPFSSTKGIEKVRAKAIVPALETLFFAPIAGRNGVPARVDHIGDSGIRRGVDAGEIGANPIEIVTAFQYFRNGRMLSDHQGQVLQPVNGIVQGALVQQGPFGRSGPDTANDHVFHGQSGKPGCRQQAGSEQGVDWFFPGSRSSNHSD